MTVFQTTYYFSVDIKYILIEGKFLSEDYRMTADFYIKRKRNLFHSHKQNMYNFLWSTVKTVRVDGNKRRWYLLLLSVGFGDKKNRFESRALLLISFKIFDKSFNFSEFHLQNKDNSMCTTIKIFSLMITGNYVHKAHSTLLGMHQMLINWWVALFKERILSDINCVRMLLLSFLLL